MLRAGMKRKGVRAYALAACAFTACALFWSEPANAQEHSQTGDLNRVLEVVARQEQLLTEQERTLRDLQRQLEQQSTIIEQQRIQLASRNELNDSQLGEIVGAGMPSSALNFNGLAADEPISLNRGVRRGSRITTDDPGGAAPAAPAPSASPSGPVGEAPPEQPHASSAVEALPEGQNALLGQGRLVIEPSIEYSRSSNNRLVFRGVEIVTGVQIGLLEANDTARDTISTSVAARYAVTDRLEVEARVPYIYRSDRVTTVAQNNNQTTQTFELDGSDLGDVEVSARYQLNHGRGGLPIFVAGARIKSDTGLGPFDLERDAQGVSTELATGSGFWGVQGSVSMLYPSDPVVLFANASYLYNIERDIDKTFGAVTVGNVDPGDSIGAGFGFGFALNPRFSYSLGYSHSYVMPTETELNDTTQESTSLQVGALQFGMSYRATERLTLSTSVDVGVTEDAPDVRVSFRSPFRW